MTSGANYFEVSVERVPLAHLPTPVQRLRCLSDELGVELYVWRDDLTEMVGSGNKIRKLEYLLAEAVANDCDHLVTCGGPQSNHARTTVYVARRLGLGVSVVLREPAEGYPKVGFDHGNLLLMQWLDADIHWLPYAEFKAQGSTYDPTLATICEQLRRTGKRPFAIPEGGSCATGVLGYYRAMAEFQNTWQALGVGERPDTLVSALGSGGTLAGLTLGAHVLGWDDLIAAVNVCDDRAYFERRVGHLIDAACNQYLLQEPPCNFRIFDGYVGSGYAQAQHEELAFYRQLAIQDGLLLDPCYTGKAFWGMIQELKKDPQVFGRKIVFHHTGGLWALEHYHPQLNSTVN